MTQYTEIIKCIVELLLAVASAILIPYIKQKVSAAKLEKLIRYADIAVPYFKMPSTSPANPRFDERVWREKAD